MKFVVDSNILFTFFWKNSTLKEILLKEEAELFSPEFALEEINKYSSEIIKKSGLTKNEFEKKKKELIEQAGFISLNEYSDFFQNAKLLAKTFSEKEKIEFLKDIDFFALALKLGFSIWTNDKLFKKQLRISVFTTREIIELLS